MHGVGWQEALGPEGWTEAWIATALAAAPMHEAPLNNEVALTSRAVKVEHDDPADRFLAATAAVYDLVLATADSRLLRGTGFKTLDNR